MSATPITSDVKGLKCVRGRGAKRFGVRAVLRRFGSTLLWRDNALIYRKGLETKFWRIEEREVRLGRHLKAAEGSFHYSPLFEARAQLFSGPTAQLHTSLVGCNSDQFGSLDDGKARKVGRGSAVASASWSAGSPLPLWQCAWLRLASTPSATSSVGELRKALMAKGIFRRLGTLQLAKAAEDCPHSKTLTRLSKAPLGSIATPVRRKLSCYSILGRCPTAIKLSLESLVTRARSRSRSQSLIGNALVFESLIREPSTTHRRTRSNEGFPGTESFAGRSADPSFNAARIGDSQTMAFPIWRLGTSALFLNLMAVGRCPRLLWCRAFGAETRIHHGLVGNSKAGRPPHSKALPCSPRRSSARCRRLRAGCPRSPSRPARPCRNNSRKSA